MNKIMDNLLTEITNPVTEILFTLRQLSYIVQ